MKRGLSLLLAAVLLLSVLTGCGGSGAKGTETAETPAAETPVEENTEPHVYDDGRARPSSCGRLRVINGKLCAENGVPVILRGVSSNGLITAESFLNEELFRELSQDDGVNLFRLAMYTYGMGIVGYCTNGDKERHKQDIADGVEFARRQDMYALIDWHILSDGDPNTYLEEAKSFFAEMAETYREYNNVLYEICNEPNGVDWPTVKRYAEQVIPVIRERDPEAVIIVGNPDWSKDLRSVAADPLAFDNILYSLHFYAATHGEDFRDMAEQLSRQGLPIFVTEFGVTASNGGFPRDLESADTWIEMLERENISYCMWSFSNVAEACSAVRSGVLKQSGFVQEDYTETGLWLMKTLAEHNTLSGSGGAYRIEKNEGRSAESYPYVIHMPSATWYLAAADIDLLGEDAYFAGLDRILRDQEADFSDARKALEGYLIEEIPPVEIYTDFTGKAKEAFVVSSGAYYYGDSKTIRLFGDWEAAQSTLLHEYVHYLSFACCNCTISVYFWGEGLADYVSKLLCENRMARVGLEDIGPEAVAAMEERGVLDPETGKIDIRRYTYGMASMMRTETLLEQEYFAVCGSKMVLRERQLEHPMMSAMSYYEAACMLDYLVGQYGREFVFEHMDCEQQEVEAVYGKSFEALVADWEAANRARCAELGVNLDE